MSNASVVIVDAKRYFDDGQVKALNGVSLEIARGEMVAVVGPSGSGKSTLLNLIGTLDFPTSGSVEILGNKVGRRMNLAALRNSLLGFIFQDHFLLPHLTLLENVMLPLQPRRLGRAQARERAESMLESVGLANRRDFLPPKVSGGERQRAAIARALVHEPAIIIGDEPTGNLDRENGAKVLRLLKELTAASSCSLILATHDDIVANEMDRVLSLVDGKLREERTLSQQIPRKISA